MPGSLRPARRRRMTRRRRSFKLVITVRAVEKYVSSIFGKLGLPSSGSESRRVLAVLLYLRQ
jgi:DNA-binding NarL/FixJ family response regulator